MQKSYRRRVVPLLAFVVLAAFAVPTAVAAHQSDEGVRTYVITVENLTDGQPLTPPVLATHRAATSVFTVGRAASGGIRGLAENGDVPGLVGELGAADHIGGITVADAVGPVLPGGSVTVEVSTSEGNQRLSIASMLICTNDGFTGVDSLKLPTGRDGSTTAYLGAYDAGTELNTEAFADLVPPCGPLTGVDSGGQGTGMSNPALAEGGVIAAHPGVAGVADLLPGLHGWADPVAKVTISLAG